MHLLTLHVHYALILTFCMLTSCLSMPIRAEITGFSIFFKMYFMFKQESYISINFLCHILNYDSDLW